MPAPRGGEPGGFSARAERLLEPAPGRGYPPRPLEHFLGLIAISLAKRLRDRTQRVSELAHHGLSRGANQLDGVHREQQLAEHERERPAK